MGKLSTSLLSSFMLASTSAQQTNAYEVIRCNNLATRLPELTFQIEADYFRNNVLDQDNNYVLANGYYTKIVPESELTLTFGPNDAGDEVIKLGYSVALASNGFQLNQDARISFGGDSLQFECQYARDILVDETFDGPPPTDITPIVGTGNLNYDIVVDLPNTGVGGTTTVTLTPLHNLNIGAKLTGCSVSHTDESGSLHIVHPVHTYNNDAICFDNSRLNFQQTQFTPNTVFTMRTFRFTVNGIDDSADVQQQTISCTLRLEPAADLVQEQADDCSCYTETECTALSGPYTSGHILILDRAQEGPTMVASLNGAHDVNTNFVYGERANHMNGSCGVVYNGEHWIFGGVSDKNMIAKIEGCQLTRQSTNMPFRYYKGGCGVFNFDGTDKILLCFNEEVSDNTSCRTYDGTEFVDIVSSQQSHRSVNSLGNYHGRPFTTGGNSDSRDAPHQSHAKTEILDIANSVWDQEDDYPFSRAIHNYAAASTDTAVYILGGYISSNLNRIAKYENGAWTQAGTLQQGRGLGHALVSGNQIILVAGESRLNIEIWNMDDATSQIIDLGHRYYNPTAFFVPAGFCSNN